MRRVALISRHVAPSRAEPSPPAPQPAARGGEDEGAVVIIGVDRMTPRGGDDGWAATDGVPSSPLDLMYATAMRVSSSPPSPPPPPRDERRF